MTSQQLRSFLFKVPATTVLLVLLLQLQACVMPTILKPNIHEVSASRTLTYDIKKPDDTEVSISDVTKAVAEALPIASKYKAYNTHATYVGSHSCVGDCRSGSRLGPTGPTGSAGKGLKVFVYSGSQVLMQYINSSSNSSGSDQTKTEVIINITRDSRDKKSFLLTIDKLTEEIGIQPGLGFVGLDPVAPIEQLAEDVMQALEKIKPDLQFSSSQHLEFSSPYPPEAVLSSYERKFGKVIASNKNNSSGTITASFHTPENLTKQSIKIEISPYKQNEAFIKASFYADYQLLEGGGNNFPSKKIKSLENALRKTATE